MSAADLAIPAYACDAQGRLILGSDLEVTSGQSAAATQQTVATATGLKRRILYVTVTYSASASVTVTVTLTSALGSAYNTTLASIVFSSNTSGLWVPATPEFVIAPGDSISVLAPSGGGALTSQVAIYAEILGLTARAVDATS